MWSTNPLERLHREIKRRCDVVGVFPDDAAIDRLVTAVIVEQHDEWQVSDRRYLSETSMARLRQIPVEVPAPPRSRRPRELNRLFSAEPGNAEIGPVVSIHR